MKKHILTGCLLAALLLVLLAGCGVTAPTPPTTTEAIATTAPPIAEYRKITAEQARDRMLQGQPYILLDCRTDEEFEESHIDGAILIPYDEMGARAPSELPDKQALILIYCRTGRRSALAAQELVAMGYRNVYDFGEIVDWPYGTVGGMTE